MNRPGRILLLAVCALCIALAAAWFRMPRQKSVERLTFQQGAAGPAQQLTRQAGPGTLRLDLMERTPLAVKVTKDIFMPLEGSRTRLAADARMRGTPAAAVPPAPPAPPAPPTPPTLHEIARTQLSAFMVIGSYSGNNKRIVFLAKGDEIRAVQTGDMVIPGYFVAAILDDRMKLRSEDGAHELILPL